jgi:hypothetical protein
VFAGRVPGGVAALRHEAAVPARELVGDKEGQALALIVGVLLYALGDDAPDPGSPPLARRPRLAARRRARWLPAA